MPFQELEDFFTRSSKVFKLSVDHDLAKKTLNDSIKNHKIPESGLEGIEKKALEVYEKLARVDLSTLTSIEAKKEYYDEFTSVFYTLLYARVSQGRRAAPLTLTFGQAEDLLKSK
jgi:hypothetical protein